MIKPPPLALSRILKDRDRLFAWLEPRVGEVPVGESFRGVASAVAALVRRSPANPAVVETARSLPSDAPLTRRALWLFAWRVAANRADLVRGVPSRPWLAQREDEWVAFEILDVVPTLSKAGSKGYLVESRAMSGTPCGVVATSRWFRGMLGARGRLLGFSRRGRRRLPLVDSRLLVNLRFAGLVSAAESKEAPEIVEFAVPSGMRTHNRDLLKMRIWREPPCPFGFRHECWMCPVGHAVGEHTCPAALHPAPWFWAACPECAREGWVDSRSKSGRCVSCDRKRKGKRRWTSG